MNPPKEKGILCVTLIREGHARSNEKVLPMIVLEELQKELEKVNANGLRMTLLSMDMPIPGIDIGEQLITARVMLHDTDNTGSLTAGLRKIIASLAGRYGLHYRVR